MKRAPSETWTPLDALLRTLEVGESGVLRLQDATLTGLLPEYEWLDNGGSWVPVLRDGADLDAPWVLDQPATPPLRPGRWWVPEESRPNRCDSSRRVPLTAARLACEVGEPRVEAWCGECEAPGSGACTKVQGSPATR